MLLIRPGLPFCLRCRRKSKRWQPQKRQSLTDSGSIFFGAHLAHKILRSSSSIPFSQVFYRTQLLQYLAIKGFRQDEKFSEIKPKWTTLESYDFGGINWSCLKCWQKWDVDHWHNSRTSASKGTLMSLGPWVGLKNQQCPCSWSSVHAITADFNEMKRTNHKKNFCSRYIAIIKT